MLAGALVLATCLAASLTGCGGSGSKDPGAASTPGKTPTSTSTTAPAGPPPGSELVGIVDLDSGNCFDPVTEPGSGDRAVWKLNCGDPHIYEVFGVIDYDVKGSGGGMPYPGVAVVQDWSEQMCYAQFEPFVGVRWTISELDIKTWWPSNESWDQGDRQVVCSVMSTDGSRLAGTQRGSKH